MSAPKRRIGDVADQVRGVTYKKEEASDTWADGMLPVLRAGNITDAGLTFDDLVYVPASKISSKQKIKQNDIVIAASSGSLSVVGKAARALNDFDGGFGAFCKVLRLRGGVDPAYFSHYFKTVEYRRAVSSLAAGININNLRNEDLDGLEVPLPPLAEQKRIAEILDAADALRAKRRESLAQLDAFLQSTFLHMFGDPVTNPMGWQLASLGEVADEIYRYPTYYGIEYRSEGVPEIRGELISKDGKLHADKEKLRFISEETSSSFPRTQLLAGDLVMSVRGTVGKVGIVPPELQGANITANLIRISPNKDAIIPEYLWQVALGSYFIEQLSRVSSSTTIRTIKAPDLRAIPIPLPPLNLQRQFVNIVQSVGMQKIRLRSHLTDLDALFASLQARAFKCEL